MISVVIPTYNRQEILKSTIRSLERQSLSPDKFEVVVIDDGSSDGTFEWLKNYSGKVTLRFKRHHRNIGTAATRNDGLREARGDIIVFLDDDIKADKELLSTYLDAHEREDCVFIGNVIYEKNPEERSLLRYLSTRGVHKGKRDFTAFVTQNVSVKRKDIESAGLFDESITIGEDIELGYRLSLLGKEFVYLKEALGYHCHTISLDKVLKDAHRLGKYTLHLFFKRYPIFKIIFRVYLAESPNLLKDPFPLLIDKLLVGFLLTKMVYRPIRRFVYFFRGIYIPPLFYDYLIFYNRMKGMREAEECEIHIS